MGEKEKQRPTISLTIRITPSQREWLQQKADEDERNAGWIIRKLLDKAMEVKHE